MPFRNADYRWNSVDVRQDDGFFHYGRIIDCTDEGLMVDFGCKLAFAPFGRIYHTVRRFSHNSYNMMMEGDQKMSVDALMRLNPDEPAKWFAATLLDRHSCFSDTAKVYLIKALTHHGTVLDILGRNNIRDRREEDVLPRSLLEKNHFVKEEVELPSGFSTGSPSPGPYKSISDDIGQSLVDNFNKNCKGNWMLATHVDGNVLHVVKKTDRYRCKFDRHYRETCQKLEGDTLRRLLEVASDTGLLKLHQQLRQVSSDFPAKLHAPSDEEVSALDILPSPILAEIFQHLDGVEQAKCRRVCTNWNGILNSADVTRMLCLPKTLSVVAHPACLVKSWTVSTQIVINTSAEYESTRWRDNPNRDCASRVACSERLFRCIMNERALPVLDVMVLASNPSRRMWTFYDGNEHFPHVIQDICDELNGFSRVCRTLLLKDLIIAFVGGIDGRLIIRIPRGRIVANLCVEDVWARMDNGLPAVTDADRVRFMEYLADGAGTDLNLELLQILNGRQSGDPRENNKCRGVVWTADDLATFDWGKLSKFTAHSLLKAASYETFVVLLTL